MTQEEQKLLDRFDVLDTALRKDLDNRSRYASTEKFLLGAVVTMGVCLVLLKAPIFLGGLVISGVGFGVSKILKGWNDDRIHRAYQEEAAIVTRLEQINGKGPVTELDLEANRKKVADFATAARLRNVEEKIDRLERKDGGKPEKIKIEKPAANG